MDADVVKTCVELGLGVGIVASIAFDAERDRALRAIDAGHLFAVNLTKLAIRRGTFLRGMSTTSPRPSRRRRNARSSNARSRRRTARPSRAETPMVHCAAMRSGASHPSASRLASNRSDHRGRIERLCGRGDGAGAETGHTPRLQVHRAPGPQAETSAQLRDISTSTQLLASPRLNSMRACEPRVSTCDRVPVGVPSSGAATIFTI